MGARWLLLVAGGLASLSCENPVGPDASFPEVPNVREYVVGAALENLDGQGHFQLPAPEWPGSAGLLLSDEAGQFALAYIRSYIADPGPVPPLPGAISQKQVIENWHGKPVDWERVSLGPRLAFFAESHLEPVSGSLPNALKNYLGPHFLVPLFVDGTQVAVVSIAAHATGLWLTSDGQVRKPSGGLNGNEFGTGGVPYSWPYGFPICPEEAVRFAAEKTGAMVTEVPVLVTPGNKITPVWARWIIQLDRDVLFERAIDGAQVQASTVQISSDPISLESVSRHSFEALQFFIAAEEQPTEERRRLSGKIGEVMGQSEFLAPIRPGIPVKLHLVSPVR